MKRQPEGIPTGGQFAADRKSEPATTLSAASRESIMRERMQPSLESAGVHGLRQNMVLNSMRQGAALDPRASDGAWNALATMNPEARSDAYCRRVGESYDAMMLRQAQHEGAPSFDPDDEQGYLEKLSYYAQSTGTMGVMLSSRKNRRLTSEDVVLGENTDGQTVLARLELEHDLARRGEDGEVGQWVSNVTFNHHSAGSEAVGSVMVGTQSYSSAEAAALENLHSQRADPKPAQDFTAALSFFERHAARGTTTA